MLLQRPGAKVYALVAPVLVGIVLSGLWWGLAKEFAQSRHDVEVAAQVIASNLAHTLEGHTARTIRDVDQTLLLLRDQYDRVPEDFADTLRIFRRSERDDLIVQVAIVDRSGTIIHSSLPLGSVPVSLADRPYFRFHQDNAEDRLLIGEPVIGRLSNKAAIPITRRINAADGEFLGVVMVTVSPTYFSRFFGGVEIGRRGVVALIGLDGVVRAVALAESDGAQSPSVGTRVPPDRPYLRPDGPSDGLFSGISPVDAIDRVNSYHRLEGVPLVVVVGLDREEFLLPVAQRQHILSLWAASLSALLGVGSLLLARQLMLQQRYRLSIAETARRLEGTNTTLLERQQRLDFVNRSLRVLNDVAVQSGQSRGERLASALKLGCDHLGLPIGIVSHVTGDDYIVEHCCTPPGAALHDGDLFSLGNTYCSITLAVNDVIAIRHMGRSDYHGHPCYGAFQLECYIGVPIIVRGQPYGTVNFSSAEPYGRDFDDGDLEFMRLLGRWAGALIVEDQMTLALKATSAQLEQVLESAAEGIYGVDVENQVTFVNAAAARMLGVEAQGILGNVGFHALGHRLADGRLCPEGTCAIRQTLIDGQVRRASDEFFAAADGTVFPVEYAVSARIEDGRVIGAVVVFRDITERKALEEELRRSNAELERFAYVTSHDLRAPLRMVASYLGLLAKSLAGRLGKNEQEFIDYAVNGAKRMDLMINDLLTYSRIGRGDEGRGAVALQDALDLALINVRVAVSESGAAIVVETPLPIVEGHQSELVRLFQNLVGNALKFVEDGQSPRISIACQRADREWLFSITDNGIGIDHADLGRLFTVFQRLVPQQQYDGTGIGLAACKKIVERHGGRIWVESAGLGQGSTFRFTLPARS